MIRNMKALNWILRAVLAVNFALFVLSFIPAISGYGREPGVFDSLWGGYRLDGWRADVVWMCASAPFILLASVPFIIVGGVTETKDIHYRRTAILCLVWLACFVVYLGWTLMHMF